MNLLTSLRYLVALAEHRHFARAAESCHITQPALSNALRALEKEFGTPIVKRARSYAGLTDEGERVLATAQRMLHEHSLLQQELASRAGQPSGRLQLGTVPTAVPIAARFAARLHALHPKIAPVIRVLSSQEIEESLDNLSLDMAFGFADRIGASGPFAVMPQYSEQYFLVRRRDPAASANPTASPPIRWLEAAALPLCLLTPEMHNRSIVDAAFAAAGTQVAPVMETNSVLTLVLAVMAGEVCSVLPGALVDALRDHGGAAGLQAMALTDPTVRTPIGLVHLARAQPSRVLEAAQLLAGSNAWLSEAASHSGSLASH